MIKNTYILAAALDWESIARFQYPWILYSLWLLPVLILLFTLYRFFGKKALDQFIAKKNQIKLVPARSKVWPSVKFGLYFLGLLFLIIACANLQFGGKKQEVKRQGIDIVFCLDVSNSMNAQDIQPNRLDRAKLYITEIVNKLGSDRIGLVVFAGDAFVQLPLTTDHGAAKLFLNTINTNLMPVQGTAIGSAIDLAMESFPKNSKRNKCIVVITDGENHEDDAEEAAKNAIDQKTKIFTVGMGTAKGAPIPILQNNQIAGYRKDADGAIVTSHLNEQMLFDLAEKGGGKYFNAYSSSDDLLGEINKIQKSVEGSVEYSDYEDHFREFLLLGFSFIVLALALPEKKWNWLQKLNL